ncbi:hypothetical protein KIPB_005819, partial [Kipferlia bialata]
ACTQDALLSSSLRDVFTGSNVPPALQYLVALESTDACLGIRFHSDATLQRTGFSATYTTSSLGLDTAHVAPAPSTFLAGVGLAIPVPPVVVSSHSCVIAMLCTDAQEGEIASGQGTGSGVMDRILGRRRNSPSGVSVGSGCSTHGVHIVNLLNSPGTNMLESVVVQTSHDLSAAFLTIVVNPRGCDGPCLAVQTPPAPASSSCDLADSLMIPSCTDKGVVKIGPYSPNTECSVPLMHPMTFDTSVHNQMWDGTFGSRSLIDHPLKRRVETVQAEKPPQSHEEPDYPVIDPASGEDGYSLPQPDFMTAALREVYPFLVVVDAIDVEDGADTVLLGPVNGSLTPIVDSGVYPAVTDTEGAGDVGVMLFSDSSIQGDGLLIWYEAEHSHGALAHVTPMMNVPYAEVLVNYDVIGTGLNVHSAGVLGNAAFADRHPNIMMRICPADIDGFPYTCDLERERGTPQRTYDMGPMEPKDPIMGMISAQAESPSMALPPGAYRSVLIDTDSGAVVCASSEWMVVGDPASGLLVFLLSHVILVATLCLISIFVTLMCIRSHCGVGVSKGRGARGTKGTTKGTKGTKSPSSKGGKGTFSRVRGFYATYRRDRERSLRDAQERQYRHEYRPVIAVGNGSVAVPAYMASLLSGTGLTRSAGRGGEGTSTRGTRPQTATTVEGQPLLAVPSEATL